jgi:hypothetical protein
MIRRRAILATLSGVVLHPLVPIHAEDRPRMRAFRDPGCECCRGRVQHIEQAGFDVNLEERPRTDPVRRTSGAPPELIGCHLALYDRFAFEGHVSGKCNPAFPRRARFLARACSARHAGRLARNGGSWRRATGLSDRQI